MEVIKTLRHTYNRYIHDLLRMCLQLVFVSCRTNFISLHTLSSRKNECHSHTYVLCTHPLYVCTHIQINFDEKQYKKYKTSIDPFNMYLFNHSNLQYAYYMQLLLYVDNAEESLYAFLSNYQHSVYAHL